MSDSYKDLLYTPGVTETTKRRNPTSRRRYRVSLADEFAGAEQ